MITQVMARIHSLVLIVMRCCCLAGNWATLTFSTGNCPLFLAKIAFHNMVVHYQRPTEHLQLSWPLSWHCSGMSYVWSCIPLLFASLNTFFTLVKILPYFLFCDWIFSLICEPELFHHQHLNNLLCQAQPEISSAHLLGSRHVCPPLMTSQFYNGLSISLSCKICSLES
jgi:hypothetical protein